MVVYALALRKHSRPGYAGDSIDRGKVEPFSGSGLGVIIVSIPTGTTWIPVDAVAVPGLQGANFALHVML